MTGTGTARHCTESSDHCPPVIREGSEPMSLRTAPLVVFTFLLGCTGAIATSDDAAAAGGPTPNAGQMAAGAPAVGVQGVAATAVSGAAGAPSNGASASTTFNLAGAPQYARFVRLTNDQWARSVQDILALPAPSKLESSFQTAVAGTTDFPNNELVLGVDQRAAADFQSAAETLAQQVSSSDAALARIYPGADPAGFITTLGRKAYRRPLTADESAAYLALFQSGATLSGPQSTFAKGAGLVIRGLLQSPHFLYRTELGMSGTPLSSYEVAAKLSLWLRGTTPSDALLDAAASPGVLDTPEGAAAMATAMLAEPTARDVMLAFHSALYHFDRYTTLTKVGVPEFDPGLNLEYLETSQRFFDKLFVQDLGVFDLLTSTAGFVGPLMAAMYGVSKPAADYEERELGTQRVGYFSQLPFLSLYGLNNEPDSIHRGVTMNLDVLCTVLGPPVAELPPIPALKPGQTNRQRISTLTGGCGGVCHNQQINPLGFAFEHFDGLGRYRDTENDSLPIVSSGMFVFSEGEASFEGAADLMRSMAAGAQAHRCYAKKLASFALQRDIVAQDQALLDELAKKSLMHASIKTLIVDLVKSDAFRVRSNGS